MDVEIKFGNDMKENNITPEDIETVDTAVEEEGVETDIENAEAEGEAEAEVTIDPIEAMISSIEDKDFVNSSNIFNDLVADKLADAIDNKKIELANRMYNNAPEEVDTEVDMEIDNEVEVEDEIV